MRRGGALKRRMRRRASLPIVVAALLPGTLAVPGIYLGIRQLADAFARPPGGGVVSLGMVLGFWLVSGSIFLAGVSVLLGGLALDVRDLRNAQCADDDRGPSPERG
jgi:hypothetical protein